MWAVTFFILFLLSSGALVGVLVVCSNRVNRLEKTCMDLQVQESRVFDFLHGLGEAFSEGVRSSELHRLVVEGATRILDAQGGALYLADRLESSLAPAYITKAMPPLVHVPQHVLAQAATSPIALDSYNRLTTVRPGDGLVGQAWLQVAPRLVTAEEFPYNEERPRSFRVESALISPLVYRRKCMGVLAVANNPGMIPFDQKDVEVFRAICEQSAFALYNEAVYFEANEKKRLDRDLEVAREIQGILLPSDPPQIPGYEISGINIPARHVSGDYFDYIRIDDAHLGVAIADVSGKGIPASLIMAMCRSVLRSKAPANTSAAQVLCEVNRQLYPDIKEDMFISMAYAVLNAEDSEVHLARAGHDAPFVYRAATDEVVRLNPKGMALGIDSGEVFDRVCSDFRFQLDPGDCILLYTDGATEALDSDGQEFGIGRLVQALHHGAAGGAREVIQRLTEDLKAFTGSFPQNDDITLIAIRKL